MAVKTAATAELQFEGVAIGKVRDVSLNINRDALETTGIGQLDRTYAYGIRNTTGSGTLLYDSENTSTRNIMNSLLSDSENLSNVKLILDTSTSLGTIEGQIVVTEVGVSVSVGSLISVPISFTVSGKPEGAF
jgi:sporulation protein YlmC with PRC-barrel domain